DPGLSAFTQTEKVKDVAPATGNRPKVSPRTVERVLYATEPGSPSGLSVALYTGPVPEDGAGQPLASPADKSPLGIQLRPPPTRSLSAVTVCPCRRAPSISPTVIVPALIEPIMPLSAVIAPAAIFSVVT